MISKYSFRGPCSSSSTPCLNYDVFLSFRGEDTRKNFTDYLYTALFQAGIRTFRDDYELPGGIHISLDLRKAIEEPRISIVVLSENYASSRWCLDELVKILECRKTIGQLVLPVFYNVDPTDVRRQTGSFAEAFARHEERFVGEMEKVERWRAALTEVANLSGWDLQSGHEAKFIQNIVGQVLLVVNHTELYVVKHPVGLDSQVAHLTELLNMGSDDVRMVGIYGMGGIGKTTIAKALYNSVYHLFEGSCVLANIREVSEKPNGLVHLQEKLLSELLPRNKFNVANVHKGISLLKARLCSKRVLIVLDDLDQLSQLDSLAGQHHWFGLGSRIIITTRNEHLLSQVDGKYKVEELDHNQSLRLFSLHAFQNPIPLENYMELSSRIVSYAGGLPLALVVLASSLTRRTTREWKSTLEKLQKIPHPLIYDKLCDTGS